MHHQKLILVLSAMDKKELLSCRKYLLGVLKKSSAEFRLFDYIWQSKHNWKSKRLEIERARNSVKAEASIKKFESLMSALMVRIEQFIILHDVETTKRQFENQLRIADFYKRKGLNKFLLQAQRKLIAMLHNFPSIDVDLQWYKLQQMHQLYFSNVDRPADNLLEQMKATLTAFYEQKQLVYEIETANLAHLYKQQPGKKVPTPPDATKTILEQQLALLKNDDEFIFLALKNSLFQQIDDFSKEDAYRLHTYLTNFSIVKIRAGKLDYLLHVNDLYNLGIEKKILFFNGKLPEGFFLNIIILRSQVSSFQEAHIHQFIENCEKYTDTPHPESLKILAWVIFYFNNEKYEKAIDVIDNRVMTDMNHRLYARVTLIKLVCQYKAPNNHLYPETLIINCKNLFKKSQKKLEEDYRLAGLNLIKLIDMLWHNAPIKKVIAHVNSCNQLAHRSWIKKEMKRLTQSEDTN